MRLRLSREDVGLFACSPVPARLDGASQARCFNASQKQEALHSRQPHQGLPHVRSTALTAEMNSEHAARSHAFVRGRLYHHLRLWTTHQAACTMDKLRALTKMVPWKCWTWRLCPTAPNPAFQSTQPDGGAKALAVHTTPPSAVPCRRAHETSARSGNLNLLSLPF